MRRTLPIRRHEPRIRGLTTTCMPTRIPWAAHPRVARIASRAVEPLAVLSKSSRGSAAPSSSTLSARNWLMIFTCKGPRTHEGAHHLGNNNNSSDVALLANHMCQPLPLKVAHVLQRVATRTPVCAKPHPLACAMASRNTSFAQQPRVPPSRSSARRGTWRR